MPTSSSTRQRSLSERTLPSQMQHIGHKRTSSTDAVTTPSGSFVNPFRGLLKSPRRNSKQVPTTTENPFLPNDCPEERLEAPAPSATCDVHNYTPSSSYLASDQISSSQDATSNKRDSKSLNSVEDAEIRSVLSSGCKTASSASTVKRSNTQQHKRQQNLRSVNEEATEEKELRKSIASLEALPVDEKGGEKKAEKTAEGSLLEKTKRRFKKIIPTGLGSAVSSSAVSTTAVVGEEENAYEKDKASSTAAPPSRGRRRSSNKKGSKTSLLVARKNSKTKSNKEEQNKDDKSDVEIRKNKNAYAVRKSNTADKNNDYIIRINQGDANTGSPVSSPDVPRTISIFDDDEDSSVSPTEDHNDPTTAHVDIRDEEDPLNLVQMWGKDQTPPPPHSSVIQMESKNENKSSLMTLLTSCQCLID